MHAISINLFISNQICDISNASKKVWWISWMNSQLKVHSQTNSWIGKHNIIAKQHNLRASLWTAWGIRTIRNVNQVAKPNAKCFRNPNQNGSTMFTLKLLQFSSQLTKSKLKQPSKKTLYFSFISLLSKTLITYKHIFFQFLHCHHFDQNSRVNSADKVLLNPVDEWSC